MKMKLLMENFNRFLNEIKSNLPIDDQEQLYADIELVQKLTKELDALRKEKDERPEVERLEDYEKREELIADRDRKIQAISTKYGIEFYFGEPGNKYLINLLKKKFRRKSL